MSMPPQKPEPRLVALHRERQLARDHLADGYAKGYLDAIELERRLELAERAATVPELRALTDDLVVHPDTQALAPGPAAPPTAALVAAPPELRLSAIFSESRQSGRWTPGRVTHVRSLFGSMKLDLREARLPQGVIELRLSVTFADLEIIVPPGISVDVGCAVMFGDVSQDTGNHPDDEGGPRLTLTGRVLFGAVRIRQRLPGETWWGAKKRKLLGGVPGGPRSLPPRDRDG
jgi:hypothetical protein